MYKGRRVSDDDLIGRGEERAATGRYHAVVAPSPGDHAVLDRRRMADRYREAALTTTTDVERIAQVSYDAGERSILELLDAYRVTSSARVRQAALDASARASEIELEFVSGWEIP